MLCALAVGAAVYVASNKKDEEPVFDITDKTPVDLFPFENNVALYDTPMATITFFDGDPDAAAKYLNGRLDEIISMNPWLGGWVHRKKGDMKLWYDEKGEDLAPFLFRKFAARDVPLTRKTPYQRLETSMDGKGVMVQKTSELVETNDSIFRLSLVPELDKPKERFALIMSLSHVGGDSHTFSEIYNMLGVGTPLIKLNPVRKMEAIDAAIERMGKREVMYVDEATRGHVWENKGKRDLQTLVFVVSDKWLRDQRLLWSMKGKRSWGNWVNRAKETVGPVESKDLCWGCSFCGSLAASQKGAVVDAPDESDEVAELPPPPPPPATVRKQPRQSIIMALLNPRRPPELPPHEILVSWFWRTFKPTVGLIAHNFRDQLPMLTDTDAGHYSYCIPYTHDDYKTPVLLRDSLEKGRRCGVDNTGRSTSLPLLGLDATFSLCPDYSVLISGDLNLGSDFQQDLHMPLYTSYGLSDVPPKVALMISFSPGRRGEVGAFVVARKSQVEVIESSGVVKEILAKF